ncbi:MAG TPA: bacillithiol biosynthesis cysteine-adding enzyme BshC [Pyrinomonadaceae bacterium]|nr:bacillithiol biosynthesis cysteine-adding enzyme BshC [Pyrinomonadaceae bacterium]
MSTTEAACYSTPEQAGLRVETLPFERIPNQSRLFLDYLRDPVALRRFYPAAVRFHHELAERARAVLNAYRTDRRQLCDALEAMNRGWGAPDETLANITKLREPDCLAVVSGQQAGLFTGPLYTIYKALSAVKLAGCLAQRGTPAVPVFWMATEDHDFAEVATAEFIGCDCRLASVSVSSEMHREGAPVGSVRLDESINETIGRLLEVLPSTEFIPDVERLLRETWEPGRGYGEAFARMMTKLTGRYGLILLDPLDAKLKQLASPLYSLAALRAPEIASALVARSRELEEAGYHAQVVMTENAFPLFFHREDGTRHAVVRAEDGRYKVKDAREEFTKEELSELAASSPERFSPNVTLRAVVQDYLLPTVAYFGGAAEIAYFAQTAEVYRILDRPATSVLPRASMTIVERRTWRTLERYGLGLTDLFEGLDAVLARVVEEHLGSETAQTFNRTEETINRELDALKEKLREVDPTLAEALDTGRRKINYQLEGLRARFHRAQMGRDRAAHRQLERATAALFPHKTLQERHINLTSLLARHGTYIVNWIYDAINLGSSDHQIVYL